MELNESRQSLSALEENFKKTSNLSTKNQIYELNQKIENLNRKIDPKRKEYTKLNSLFKPYSTTLSDSELAEINNSMNQVIMAGVNNNDVTLKKLIQFNYDSGFYGTEVSLDYLMSLPYILKSYYQIIHPFAQVPINPEMKHKLMELVRVFKDPNHLSTNNNTTDIMNEDIKEYLEANRSEYYQSQDDMINKLLLSVLVNDLQECKKFFEVSDLYLELEEDNSFPLELNQYWEWLFSGDLSSTLMIFQHLIKYKNSLTNVANIKSLDITLINVILHPKELPHRQALWQMFIFNSMHSLIRIPELLFIILEAVCEIEWAFDPRLSLVTNRSERHSEFIKYARDLTFFFPDFIIGKNYKDPRISLYGYLIKWGLEDSNDSLLNAEGEEQSEKSLLLQLIKLLSPKGLCRMGTEKNGKKYGNLLDYYLFDENARQKLTEKAYLILFTMILDYCPEILTQPTLSNTVSNNQESKSISIFDQLLSHIKTNGFYGVFSPPVLSLCIEKHPNLGANQITALLEIVIQKFPKEVAQWNAFQFQCCVIVIKKGVEINYIFDLTALDLWKNVKQAIQIRGEYSYTNLFWKASAYVVDMIFKSKESKVYEEILIELKNIPDLNWFLPVVGDGSDDSISYKQIK